MSERRTLDGLNKNIVFLIAVSMSLFQIGALTIFTLDPWLFRATHLAFASLLVFLLIPATKSSPKNKPTIVDIIFALLIIIITVYIFVELDTLVFRMGVDPIISDVIIGALAIILLLEMTRRVAGVALPIIAIIFITYVMIGPYLPGVFWHRGYSVSRLVSFLFSTDGIYTTPLGVSARFIFVFILLGAFMNFSGAGQFFINLAHSVAGGTRGGPAKVSIIASTLFGSISGSSVTNVVSTGVFTIPLMKSVGYRKSFAGAVEAVASTGGQVTPPILGSAAFLMLEILQIPYTEIIVASLIPCYLYYLNVFLMVDVEAKKEGLVGLPRNELPDLKNLLVHNFQLLLPLLILIFALVILRSSPMRAGLFASLLCVIVSWKSKETRMGYKKIVAALSMAAKNSIYVVTTCAVAGIIVGVIALTGFGVRIATIIVSLSGGNQFLALIMTMFVSILLGMGMPTVAAYAVAASVVAPALIQLGLPELAVHMFIFYYACFSAITPPIALASYAGAAIAEAGAGKVSWEALKLGITAFIMPYLFIFNTTLLAQGNFINIFLDVFSASLGIWAFVGALKNMLLYKLKLWERIFCSLAAILLLMPGISSDIVGLALFLSVGFQQVIITRKSINLKNRRENSV